MDPVVEAGSANIGSLQDSEDGDQNHNSGRRLRQDVTVDPQVRCLSLLFCIAGTAVLLQFCRHTREIILPLQVSARALPSTAAQWLSCRKLAQQQRAQGFTKELLPALPHEVTVHLLRLAALSRWTLLLRQGAPTSAPCKARRTATRTTTPAGASGRTSLSTPR